MGNSVKASNLYSEKLRSGGTLKIIKKYWKAWFGLIFINYIGVNYGCPTEYRNRVLQYIISIGIYKVENCKCEVIGYIIKINKIYTYIILKYTNCRENY